MFPCAGPTTYLDPLNLKAARDCEVGGHEKLPYYWFCTLLLRQIEWNCLTANCSCDNTWPLKYRV